MKSHEITWLSHNRKAKCSPNPNFPEGIHMDTPEKGEKCHIDIPYPSPECGIWMVKCLACDRLDAITAAGRPDDPRSYKMPCKINNKKGGNNAQ